MRSLAAPQRSGAAGGLAVTTMSVHSIESVVSGAVARPAVSLPKLRDMVQRGYKVAMLTCYDATFARVLDDAGVDVLLVGDSLGNVIQGETSTLPVTLAQMAYHTRCVAQGKRSAWLITDLPFGTYEASPQQAFESAAELMRAGAQMVKLEGGGVTAETVRFLTERGIPVCAHLGLTPQRVHALGGFRIQGRDDAAAAVLMTDARNDDHRHRCRCRHGGAGVGVARSAGLDFWQAPAFCPGLHPRAGQ
jgi:3-methyl-2-oxobutanoate hydroxymethyltransferase